MNIYLQDLTRGIIKENPTFRLVLGMCPVLGVTVTAKGGVGMGLATMAVLICSNVVISALRNYIPKSIRIPIYIVIIATFVTVVDMLLAAYQPELHKQLGIFIPLIVVNCIILGRAEAFAGKRPVLRSLFDGVGIGIGFTLALFILAAVREILGQGTLFDIAVTGPIFQPMGILALPPGAFLVLGLMLAGVNALFERFGLE
ncbi:MAG: electron transport complex subunit E [Firmicutes bacterium]|jgi:electron transport complex protein RnfE|nr:electron transport complex subunit E [Bacillota bacterium]